MGGFNVGGKADLRVGTGTHVLHTPLSAAGKQPIFALTCAWCLRHN
jgi:hypothetical protein